MYRILFLMIAFVSPTSFAADVSDCKKLSNSTERLICYDDYHGYGEELISESEKVLTRKGFSILPHRPTYIMPVSYNNNRTPLQEVIGTTTTGELDSTEVKFQISFKLPLWDEIIGENSKLWAGFTQKSYWQMYNSDISAPFRETNYAPEIFISKKTNFDIFGLKLLNTTVGFVHESNGRSNLLSRSWNRVYAQFALQKNDFIFSIKPWWRIEEDFEDDNNPDIDDYLGSYELGMLYQYNDNEFTLMLRNLNGSKQHETFQLGWLFPINQEINFYMEYFHGYGESLIDYNQQNESISMGFSITDWID